MEDRAIVSPAKKAKHDGYREHGRHENGGGARGQNVDTLR